MIGQRSFTSKVIVKTHRYTDTHTHTHTHIGLIALPGQVKWSIAKPETKNSSVRPTYMGPLYCLNRSDHLRRSKSARVGVNSHSPYVMVVGHRQEGSISAKQTALCAIREDKDSKRGKRRGCSQTQLDLSIDGRPAAVQLARPSAVPP